MWSESQLKKNKNTELFIGNTATALYFSLWAAWIFPEFNPKCYLRVTKDYLFPELTSNVIKNLQIYFLRCWVIKGAETDMR